MFFFYFSAFSAFSAFCACEIINKNKKFKAVLMTSIILLLGLAGEHPALQCLWPWHIK